MPALTPNEQTIASTSKYNLARSSSRHLLFYPMVCMG